MEISYSATLKKNKQKSISAAEPDTNGSEMFRLKRAQTEFRAAERFRVHRKCSEVVVHKQPHTLPWLLDRQAPGWRGALQNRTVRNQSHPSTHPSPVSLFPRGGGVGKQPQQGAVSTDSQGGVQRSALLQILNCLYEPPPESSWPPQPK